MNTGLFPVKVQAGDDVYDQARFYGTDEFSELWTLTNGQPAVAVAGAGLVKQGRGVGVFMADGTRAKWTLELADGTTWLATPTGGCGCGHRLKSWNPAKVVRS